MYQTGFDQIKASKSHDESYVEEVYLRHQLMAQHKKWANGQGYSLPFDGKVCGSITSHVRKLMKVDPSL